jgi:hypothetical protein
VPDDLRAFLAELRARLERGEFAGHPPIWLGNELTLTNAETAVRGLLRQVDAYAAMPPEQRRDYPYHGRRLKLAGTLRRLREHIGYKRCEKGPAPLIGLAGADRNVLLREGVRRPEALS